MSKHFYFGTSVFFILFVYAVDAIGASMQTVLTVGIILLITLCGMILNELCEIRTQSKAFQDQVREHLEQISFELQIMRDCHFDQMQERTKGLSQTIEVLAKLAEKKDNNKEAEPTAYEEK